jgi:WbqC-like protein family
MRGAILQPTYLPWLGYFEMILSSDIFVIYDHVQFVKKSWHHRNYIKGPNGKILLSIPTKKSSLDTSLCDINLGNEYEKSLSKHWESIYHAYKKSKYFSTYKYAIESMYANQYLSLTDLTISFIEYFCGELGINVQFIKSSSLILNGLIENPTERVIDLCRAVNITELYDASGAQKIIDVNLFKKNNISIAFQKYEHPVYKQVFRGFEPYMSILDLLFNEGPDSLGIISSGRRNPIKPSTN